MATLPCSFSRKKETIHVGIPCSSRPIRSITALAPSSVMSISKGAFELKQRSGESKKALAAWTSPSNSSQDACRATINPYRRRLSHKEKTLQSSRSTRVRKKYPCAYQAALHRYTTSRIEIEMREKAYGAERHREVQCLAKANSQWPKCLFS